MKIIRSNQYFWYLLILIALLIFISQRLGESDVMGLVDAASMALFSFGLISLATLLSFRLAAILSAVIVVLNLVLVFGSRVYLELYQSYLPFGLLEMAPESVALITSFPLWQVSLVALSILLLLLVVYRLFISQSVPAAGELLIAGLIMIVGGMALQLVHDSRSVKRFSPYSESPMGHFLRSGGLLPFIVGSPYDERWANINALTERIRKGQLDRLPDAYAEAIKVLLPNRKVLNPMYPLYQPASETISSSVDNQKSSETEGKARNVIVIVLESFRASESAIYGHQQSATPFLDELASRSIVARQFYANSPLTSKSEIAIHCGVLDYFGGQPISTRSRFPAMTCVPEILRSAGYETLFIHGNKKSYYRRDKAFRSMGFNRLYGIEDFYQGTFDDNPWSNVGKGTVVEPTLGWGMPDTVLFDLALEKLVEVGAPFYAEILSLSNHFPFDWPWGIEFPEHLRAESSMYERYRRGLFYTDWALRQFIEKFRASDLYDNTIVVITGDHGIWTFENREDMSDLNKQEQFFRVPLLIYSKDLESGVVDNPASHVDIPATVLSLLGVHVPTAFLGRSLLDENTSGVPVYTLLETAYGFRQGNRICVPTGRCFRDGEEDCDEYSQEWVTEGEMACFLQGETDAMFDKNPRQVLVEKDGLNQVDVLLNYMMLGLGTGFVPEFAE